MERDFHSTKTRVGRTQAKNRQLGELSNFSRYGAFQIRS